MSTTNNHNQNPKGTAYAGHSVGERLRKTTLKLDKWVVVESPGTEFEKVVFTSGKYEIARNWMERHYTDDFYPADVMKRLPNGELTTEF